MLYVTNGPPPIFMGGSYYPSVPCNRLFSTYSYLEIVVAWFCHSGWLEQHSGKEAEMCVCAWFMSFLTMKYAFKMLNKAFTCLLSLSLKYLFICVQIFSVNAVSPWSLLALNNLFYLIHVSVAEAARGNSDKSQEDFSSSCTGRGKYHLLSLHLSTPKF